MRTPDKQLHLLLLAVVGFNILPHTLQQPPWLIATAFLLLLWAGLHQYRGTRLPGKHLRSALAIGGFVAVIAQWNTVLGQEPATGLLVILSALKLLETTRYRDAMLVIFTSYFLLMAYLLVDQSLFSTLYMALDVLLITALMFHMHKSDRRSSLRSFRPVMRLLAVALPVWIFLFVAFPRFSTGFWSLKSAGSTSTGFSDDMNPGDVERLLESDEVAFRAVFPEGGMGSPEEMYWRGGVLFYAHGGLNWSRTGYMTLSPASERPVPGSENRANPVEYDIYLEPRYKKWLFTLDTPINVDFSDPLKNAAVQRRSGFLYETNREVSSRILYRGSSVRRSPELEMSEDRRAIYLQVPTDLSPAVQQLAQKLKSETNGTTRAIIDRTLKFYDDEKFVYTRSPGALKTGRLDEFLFETKRGFCEHYAASFATLMRAMGIPARIVIGFMGGQVNGFSQYVIVRNLDAHAWSEVWSQESKRWVRVDPTSLIAPLRLQMGGLYHEENQAAQSLYGRTGLYRLQRKLDLAWDAAAMQWNQFLLNYDFDYQKAMLQKLGFKEASRMVFFIWCGIGLIAFIVILQFFLKWRARKEEPLLAAYHQFCKRLEKSGIERKPNEGPQSYFSRLRSVLPNQSSLIQKVEREFIELRYGRRVADKKTERARIREFSRSLGRINFKEKSSKAVDLSQ